MRRIRGVLVLWAAREVLAQPGAVLLTALALMSVTAMLASGLLLSQALTATTSHLLDAGPDLVVRRVGPEGWRPIPAGAAAAAMTIPGVIDARPRVWGTARLSETVVSVVAADDAASGRRREADAPPTPAPGEAVVGGGIRLPAGTTELSLAAIGRIRVRAARRFPDGSGLATHDLVLLNPEDARMLLGMPAEAASDLALRVFHSEEAEALRPELSRAFPWPVHIATREDTRKHYAAAFGRRGGLAAVLYMPAALAMFLLVAVIVRQQIGGRGRVGLLKALGWTSRDILALQVVKALLVGLPALALGMTLAHILVYAWPQPWVGHLLLGWQQTAPLLHLDTGFAGPVFLEVGGLLLTPYLAAVVWSSLVVAASDPQDLLNRRSCA